MNADLRTYPLSTEWTRGYEYHMNTLGPMNTHAFKTPIVCSEEFQDYSDSPDNFCGSQSC